MNITDKDILDTAKLAQLSLTEEEVTTYRSHVGGVLDYFKTLDAVDVSHVDEMGHITGRENVLRADEESATSAEDREKLLGEFPSGESGYIKVKNVL